MWIISAASLVIVIVLCVTGAAHSKFNDNLGQRVGLGLVAMAMWPRLLSLLEDRSYATHMPDWTLVGQHVGLAAYAVGTAYKVWRYRDTPVEPPTQPGELHEHNPWERSS